MAACGANACAQEEKGDGSKNLFNYKPLGERAPEYKEMPNCDNEKMTLDEYVQNNRAMFVMMTGGMAKIPMFVDAVSKTTITKMTVEKSKICDGDILVHILRPKNLPEKNNAAMIFAHGGPGIAGTAEQFNPMFAFAANIYGVIGFNVDYRLAPEHGNKGGSDIYATLKYVYDNADKLGVDKTKIGMEGESAGAHHMFNACHLMALNNEKPICKMMISEIGMFTSVLKFTKPEDLRLSEEKNGVGKMDFALQAFAGDDYKKQVDNRDPMLFPELVDDKILATYPPTVFISPEFCFFHSATERLANRMREAKNLLEFRLVRGLGHMYKMIQNKEVEETLRDRIICVNTYLKE